MIPAGSVSSDSSRACLVLIGAPAVGKSTLGRRLARRLSLPFVDIDQQIVAQEKLSIPEIFSIHGEAYFRQREVHTIMTHLGRRAVVALGGGAVSNDVANLLDDHLVIWLQADPQEVIRRLGSGADRPVLAGSDDIGRRWLELYTQREPAYRRMCDIEYKITSQSIDKNVENLLCCIEGGGSERGC